jgi:hypothetical protein
MTPRSGGRRADSAPSVAICHEAFCYVGDDGVEHVVKYGRHYRPSDDAVRRRPDAFHDALAQGDATPATTWLGGWRAPGPPGDRPFTPGELSGAVGCPRAGE